MADQCAGAGTACRQCDGRGDVALPRIFQGIAFIARQSNRSGNGSHITIGIHKRHGLEVELAAIAVTAEPVDLAIHQNAGWDNDLVAGSDGRNYLRVDLISATDVAALNGMREHQRNAGSGGHDDGCSGCRLRAGLFV